VEVRDVLRDVVEMCFDREVARVEAVYFGGRKVGKVGIAARRG
jgi:hypothetical protein